ncbi:LysR family transcriptional regulator [Bordetella genomosp. 9]|uniref:LysR family transcriptional regulator n=1 Tax=Bordetella genomosp. 9 TaxID=1416803 RepID=A0A1W6Z6B2_9BORD|nr:LysR family transcriptional regulator [Bordetella genomosp. 9]ARP88734.1 LysR family transcriptional regulator [Bordetella genomosp. 9]ARP92723.1 LysR family transcriptional regulator [Bordetella genomosp. 9]
MDRFKQLQTFVDVASLGSLSAAARAEGVAPAMIGRRIDALESRLGVKLLVRSTRRISLTAEGSALLEDAQRILRDLNESESLVAQGSARPTGLLRVTAPAGFGRRHVAPLLPGYAERYPDVGVTLDLSDRLADLIEERYDCAVRIGDLGNSGMVAVRLADNQRVVVAAPAYLRRHGTPRVPADLANHHCLSFGSQGNQPRGWLFRVNGQVAAYRVSGRLECSDGSVLHQWTLAGCGLAWRSMWEVRQDLESGRLETVLDEYRAPPNGIYAVLPERKHIPARVRAFVDMLREAYADPAYWAAPAIA